MCTTLHFHYLKIVLIVWLHLIQKTTVLVWWDEIVKMLSFPPFRFSGNKTFIALVQLCKYYCRLCWYNLHFVFGVHLRLQQENASNCWVTEEECSVNVTLESQHVKALQGMTFSRIYREQQRVWEGNERGSQIGRREGGEKESDAEEGFTTAECE